VAGVGVNTITLNPLNRKSLLPATMTCTTTNLTSSDSVKVTYQSGTPGNNSTVSLSSTNGTTWTATLASGTQLASSGTSQPFNFSLKRTSDNATATTAITVALV
jgi:hemolysin activation/secretion protein